MADAWPSCSPRAKAAQASAYAPYSRFTVGAALRADVRRALRGLQCRERRLSARHLRRGRRHRRDGRWRRHARIAEIAGRGDGGALVHALRRLPAAHPRIRRSFDAIHIAGPEGVRADASLWPSFCRRVSVPIICRCKAEENSPRLLTWVRPPERSIAWAWMLGSAP